LDTALQQEKRGAEQAGFRVKTAAEVFIRRIHTEPAVDRQEHGAHDDQRERQPEIILDERDSALIRLPRQRKVGDGAGLRRHDGQPDRPPLRRAAALQVSVEVVGVPRPPRAVRRDAEHGPEEHQPVDEVHA
jgi:hypothetical protein